MDQNQNSPASVTSSASSASKNAADIQLANDLGITPLSDSDDDTAATTVKSVQDDDNNDSSALGDLHRHL